MILFSLFSTVLCLWCLRICGAASSNRRDSDPTVQVKNGTLVGTHNEAYDQDFFLGVPFAQPPVGDLRLRNPQSLNATFETLEVKDYSPLCVGYGFDQRGYNISEDCLTLNIVRPTGYQEGSQLPVALWIHGGGFFMGGSGDRRFNLSFIVQNSVEMGKPVIGVSINYRLAQWGFLGGSEVQEEGIANLGLKDQRLALHWIKENIGVFGGDCDKVTLFGESGGGDAVIYHTTMFGGRDDGLFRGIIVQSSFMSPLLSNQTSAQEGFDNVISATGCGDSEGSSISCLRQLPYEELNAAFNETGGGTGRFAVIQDNDLVQDLHTNQLEHGNFVNIPLLAGANTDEGPVFGIQGVNTDGEFESFVTFRAPLADAESIAQLYPDDPDQGIPATLLTRPEPGSELGVQYKRVMAFAGDHGFHAVRRQLNQQWSKRGLRNYSYRFNARPNGLPDYIGVTHFQEVAFVFYNTNNVGYDPPVPRPFENRGVEYYELALLMSRMWISFVNDLDPNNHGQDATTWPKYSTSSPQNFVFDANVTSYVEPDVYRYEGIQFIIDNSVEQFTR